MRSWSMSSILFLWESYFSPSVHTPEGQKHASEMSALGRVGQPDDIADIVAFLASADSRWVTGQMIDATGGSHL